MQTPKTLIEFKIAGSADRLSTSVQPPNANKSAATAGNDDEEEGAIPERKASTKPSSPRNEPSSSIAHNPAPPPQNDSHGWDAEPESQPQQRNDGHGWDVQPSLTMPASGNRPPPGHALYSGHRRPPPPPQGNKMRHWGASISTNGHSDGPSGAANEGSSQQSNGGGSHWVRDDRRRPYPAPSNSSAAMRDQTRPHRDHGAVRPPPPSSSFVPPLPPTAPGAPNGKHALPDYPPPSSRQYGHRERRSDLDRYEPDLNRTMASRDSDINRNSRNFDSHRRDLEPRRQTPPRDPSTKDSWVRKYDEPRERSSTDNYVRQTSRDPESTRSQRETGNDRALSKVPGSARHLPMGPDRRSPVKEERFSDRKTSDPSTTIGRHNNAMDDSHADAHVVHGISIPPQDQPVHYLSATMTRTMLSSPPPLAQVVVESATPPASLLKRKLDADGQPAVLQVAPLAAPSVNTLESPVLPSNAGSRVGTGLVNGAGAESLSSARPPPTASSDGSIKVSRVATVCRALDDLSSSSVRHSNVPRHRDDVPMSGRERRRTRPARVPLDKRVFVGCSSLDDYEISVKLGQGTFGEVLKGRHILTGVPVALKKVTIHDDKDGLPITALREIKLLKKLRHPSVVPVLDMTYRPSGERGKLGDVYMVEPYMDHDLNGMLENPNIRLEHSQIKLYMKQLLEGTLYLHKNRILHRDMKAANLLINNLGQLQIADFGLARPYRDPGCAWAANGWKGGLNKYTNMVVTRWYRPPELLAGEKKYGPPIDLWGIGCILAEMVTGKPLFKGTSEINQLELISRLCGSPNESNFPGWSALPGVKDADPSGRPDAHPEVAGRHDFGGYNRCIKEHFRTVVDVGSECADLIDKLLVLDPTKRMTAQQALDHDWFWSKPYPADPSTLPKYEHSKEIDRQKREWKPVAAAPPRHTGAPPPPPPQQGPRQMMHHQHQQQNKAMSFRPPPPSTKQGGGGGGYYNKGLPPPSYQHDHGRAYAPRPPLPPSSGGGGAPDSMVLDYGSGPTPRPKPYARPIQQQRPFDRNRPSGAGSSRPLPYGLQPTRPPHPDSLHTLPPRPPPHPDSFHGR